MVLGVVRGYGRAHGYLIGNDLISWGAGDWANIKWGSIYHALKQLTKDGYLDEDWPVPGRTDYQLTEAGEFEYKRLLAEAFRRPQPRPDMLFAGLAMLPSLEREEAIGLLEQRLAHLESARAEAAEKLDGWQEPPHVRELYGLWVHTADGGISWTRGLIDRLRSGEYPMAGDPGSPGVAGSWPLPA
ncbi:PadR family transcriptional regulator [Kutzneria viridogrisea]